MCPHSLATLTFSLISFSSIRLLFSHIHFIVIKAMSLSVSSRFSIFSTHLSKRSIKLGSTSLDSNLSGISFKIVYSCFGIAIKNLTFLLPSNSKTVLKIQGFLCASSTTTRTLFFLLKLLSPLSKDILLPLALSPSL